MSLGETEATIISEEEGILSNVQAKLAAHVVAPAARMDFDKEMMALRDQLAEERAEDHAMLVEHMTRLAALRRAQDRETVFPADPQNPYFAHLRLTDKHKGEARERDVLIGRRAFINTKAGVHIVDWRNSPISRIYYCYNEADEYEEEFAGELQTGHVNVRRTLTVRRGVLERVRTADMALMRTPEGWGPEAVTRQRLEGGVGTAIRPPSGVMGGKADNRLPEITAMIDPEQFRIITDRRTGVVIIRGGAGTGKTTIALHRVAYLHFQDRKRFAAKRIQIITPGLALKRYVASVLPALDVSGVPIDTFGGWAMRTLKRLVPGLKRRKLTDATPVGAGRLKRHAVVFTLIEEAVAEQARSFDPVIKAAGGDVLLKAWVQRRNLPPMARITALSRWIKTQDGLNTVPIRRAIDTVKDELSDPLEMWAELLTDRGRVEKALKAAGAQYYEWELDNLVESVSAQSDEPADRSDIDPHLRTGIDGASIDAGELQGHLDVDDVAILLRICQLRYGRLTGPSGQKVNYEHVVVDEAQDLPPIALAVLCGAVQPGGPVTLAGDTAQRLSLDNGFGDWDAVVDLLNLSKVHMLPPLAVAYRSTRQVMEVARHVLGPLAPADAPQDAREGAPVELFRFEEQGEAVAFLGDALKSLRSRERRASVALVARSAKVADIYYAGLKRADVGGLRRVREQEFDFTPGIDITDVVQIKGLEYDYIVLIEATAEQWPVRTENRHLLHVALTRAAHQLWLICSDAPSPLLPEALIDGG
ncbi:MAG: DNA helicase-2/ATP-dependent DNA helicase PcrA [Bradymonadia bacterium]|jgi:DNA helicase-2/ATP-dependent DNA helicase PcrA